MKRIPFILIPSLIACLLGPLATAEAQRPPVHYFQSGMMPPGSVGRGKLAQDPRLVGHVQPVQVTAPKGAKLSIAANGAFTPPEAGPLLVGLEISPVYQFKVTEIEFADGVEVFPTIELINRLYPPPGKETRFPIPIELTQEELEMAMRGIYVTRVIYLEDPDSALPVRQKEQTSFDVRADEDPLRVADELGKPMAILRLGSRVPTDDQPGVAHPPVVRYAQPEVLPVPTKEQIDGAIIRENKIYPRLPLPADMQRGGNQRGQARP